MTDATLVLRTLDGESEAFTELYDRYARLVRAICHDSTRDVNTASDLAQEVFLRAYRKLNLLKAPESFGPWLISIARNVGREYRRGQARDRHFLVGLEPPEEPKETRNFVEDDRVEMLQKAMAELDERERLALHVHYLQNQKADQGPKIMAMSRSSYYRLLERAKRKVERYIEREESK